MTRGALSFYVTASHHWLTSVLGSLVKDGLVRTIEVVNQNNGLAQGEMVTIYEIVEETPIRIRIRCGE